MTGPSRAVFLSYASQDAEAAQRICEALSAAGIEVWFDQSALRGGDAWDQKIRREIRDCDLFIPIISAHTQGRLEGYFRLEWKLAVDRSHLMAAERAFLVPVVVDNTPDAVALVPDRFREVQWTRLTNGEISPAFIDRLKQLLAVNTALSKATGLPAQARAGREVAGSALPWPGRARTHASSRAIRASVLAGGVLGAALLAGVGWVGLERVRGSAHPAAQGESIAVLPLQNESGDANQQYFSDGISEDLITALAQFPALKVIGRSSSFQFRDSKEDSRSIGSKLGVAHLLEGSVRRSGATVRVIADLINTADGSTQWSERYDRPYKDLFALQDEITQAVVGALRTKLLPGGRAPAQSDRPPGGSLDAYTALLQGRFYRDRETEADLRKAIESLTRATEIDPRYAVAWSQLALVWTGLGNQFVEGEAAQEAYGKAGMAVERALRETPELAVAHIARGFLLQAEFDWRGAESEFRRAVELAPNNSTAKFALGRQLAVSGEVEQAIGLTRSALTTEPLRAGWCTWLATYLAGLHRLDEAEAAVRRAIELQPAASYFHEQLAIIEVQRGNMQAALAAAQQEPPGYWRDTALALTRQIGPDRGAADAALKTLIDQHAAIAAYQIAQVYALRNDARATFEWLDRALTQRDPGIEYLLLDPFILRYERDPRLAAFCRKVGLPVRGETAAGKSS